MFRRRQRLFVEMEQMASRPFSEVSSYIFDCENTFYINQQSFTVYQVLVDIETRRLETESLTPVIESVAKSQRKRKKVSLFFPIKFEIAIRNTK